MLGSVCSQHAASKQTTAASGWSSGNESLSLLRGENIQLVRTGKQMLDLCAHKSTSVLSHQLYRGQCDS